jgi:hypothetical protein
MNFEVFGPFHVSQTADGNIDPTNEAKRKFWEVAEKRRAGLRNAHGCYIFVVKAGSTEKAWYVGKSQKQKFKDEIFTGHKLDIYNRSTRAVLDAPQSMIYLIARVAKDRRLLPPRGAPRTIAFVEEMLIGMALASNRELENQVDTKILRELEIPGLHDGRGKSAPGKAALTLAKILQLPKKSTSGRRP